MMGKIEINIPAECLSCGSSIHQLTFDDYMDTVIYNCWKKMPQQPRICNTFRCSLQYIHKTKKMVLAHECPNATRILVDNLNKELELANAF